MKLLQMLTLTKLRKLLSQPFRVCEDKIEETEVNTKSDEELIEELTRKDQIGAALAQIMTDYRETRGCMNPIPSFKGVGVSLGQLSTFPPTQVRNIGKCFARTVDDFIGWRGGYSDQTLEALLVERGADTIEGPVCRKSTPTVLITKRSEYKRKVNGEYHQENVPSTVINSWSH